VKVQQLFPMRYWWSVHVLGNDLNVLFLLYLIQ